MTDSYALPPTELFTLRYQLRLSDPTDAPDALLMLQDPAVAQWHPSPAVVDVATAADWCRRGADWTLATHATFAIVDRSGGRLVGNISLSHIDQTDQRDAAVAYRIAPWGRGVGAATESVVAVSAWAFSTLAIERIRLEHSVGNPASCRVATKSGFVFEGLLREGFRDESGIRHDAHLHARLAKDVAQASTGSSA